MKTKLFSALALVAAFAFVSCDNEKKEDPNALSGIEVRPSSISLIPEGTQRLSVVTVPATADFPEVIEWTSSDEEIATVNERGVVTAVAVGEATITAKAGEFTGSCSVNVVEQAPISFTNVLLYDVDTLYFANEDGTLDITPITTSDGSETFNCYKSLATLYIMSEGLYVSDAGYFTGAETGYVITMQTPMWYGTDYINPETGGVSFSLGKYKIVEEGDTLPVHGALAGEIDEAMYIPAVKEYAAKFSAFQAAYLQYMTTGSEEDLNAALAAMQEQTNAEKAAAAHVSNTIIEKWSWVETESGSGYSSEYIPTGLVSSLNMELNGDGISRYMTGVTYASIGLKFLNGFYGLPFEQDPNTYAVTITGEELGFVEFISITGEVPAESPALVATPANVFKEKCPMQAMMIESRRMNNDKYSLIKK